MGWQDRAYNREDEPTRGGFGGGGFPPAGGGGGFGMGSFAWSSITGILLVINIAVFFFNLLTQDERKLGLLETWGYFSYDTAIIHLQVWRFITFQFLHADFFHILFNMFALFMFGPMIERHLGSRRYLAFYLLCGVAGACMYLLLYAAGIIDGGSNTRMVGASAGIFGILVGAAVIAPNMKVMLLFPPIPMKLRTMAIALLALAAFLILTGGRNAGGEAAHLGGAVAGFLLIRQAWLLNFADLGAKYTRMSNPQRSSFASKVAQYQQDRQKKKQQDLEAEIDRILIKVKEKGLQSLTDAEKKTLQQETDRKRGR